MPFLLSFLRSIAQWHAYLFGPLADTWARSSSIPAPIMLARGNHDLVGGYPHLDPGRPDPGWGNSEITGIPHDDGKGGKGGARGHVNGTSGGRSGSVKEDEGAKNDASVRGGGGVDGGVDGDSGGGVGGGD